ncbi:LuxR C-terminal-related transcriptional regulator [Nocardioides nitrophenolicus]|uniref:LuxR C-terminal-related transcriptional regulator n=1 Tax=Nocardioides nitrophenolicus TaxID=60489 RepID=UPI0027DC89F1|nr:LuxR C-terminal-related transcriptional regulator [Nocardioides nitrophenolicus]MBM7517057.1 DNA-binding CsgD family transcriptional regulator [Nocardioides nitrophenolicus]
MRTDQDRSAIESAAAQRQLEIHAQAIAEQADRHSVTLESVLAILRSPDLSDKAARTLAIDTAVAALVDIRTTTDRRERTLLEPVVGAFERLRTDLRPIERFSDLDLQFVDPPPTGRALPSHVAHSARAIVRAALLASLDGGQVRRVRIHWDCDGRNLLIGVRDDGAGRLAAHDDSLRSIAERVSMLHGTLGVSSTPGWGTSIEITLPLDPPPEQEPALETYAQLTDREQDVLRLVAAGARNREIAAKLSISPNTVKFHVSNLLRKLGARSRAELASLAR